jgi:hypothetical protein
MPKKMNEPGVANHVAEADQKQEAGGDAAGVDLPAAESGEAGCHIAEELQIPCEMVADHGQQRYAAGCINGLDAAGWNLRSGSRRR